MSKWDEYLQKAASRKANYTELFQDKNALTHRFNTADAEIFLHRNKELESFYNVFGDIFQEVNISMVILGKNGMGKSALTDIALKSIKKYAKTQNKEFTVIKVDADIYKTEFAIYYNIIKQLPLKEAKEKIRNNTHEAFTIIMDYLKENETPLVIVFDYCQKLTSIKAIDMLQRIDEFIPNRKNSDRYCTPNLIFLTTEYPFAKDFHKNSGFLSRFAPHIIEMKPYNAEEIRDILSERAKIALKPDVVSDEIIMKIADHVGNTSGILDAAFNVLYHATTNAENKGDTKILIEDIDAIIKEHSY
jgi:cell division control protein 6